MMTAIDLFQAGRDRHRPQTRDEMRVAVHELAARGMSDHTIAQATGLAVEQVRRLIGEQEASRRG
jgi:hypothetical protein